ncbi:zinc-binding dehydrogenase [Streptomyces diastatochromogenes]|uniref:zinc-binding dehydrogenase n=1 Tax=Streptomyces diastatochromogenes TaxID=42236 RepID=UPI0031345CA1
MPLPAEAHSPGRAIGHGAARREGHQCRGATYSSLFMKANGDQPRELTPLIDAGGIRPVVDTAFAFESTGEALEYLAAGRATAGRVVSKMT